MKRVKSRIEYIGEDPLLGMNVRYTFGESKFYIFIDSNDIDWTDEAPMDLDYKAIWDKKVLDDYFTMYFHQNRKALIENE